MNAELFFLIFSPEHPSSEIHLQHRCDVALPAPHPITLDQGSTDENRLKPSHLCHKLGSMLSIREKKMEKRVLDGQIGTTMTAETS